jgi:arginine metabolism regulation protein II
MPIDKRRGTAKRRTHNLGGCATCRRRHVKCDQSRPTCGTCRRAGHECGGYSSEVRWMSMSYGPSKPSRTSSENKQSLQSNQGAIKVLFARFVRTKRGAGLAEDCGAGQRPDGNQLPPVSETVQSPNTMHRNQSITTAVQDPMHDTGSFAMAGNDRSTDPGGSVNSSILPHELGLFDQSLVESTRDYESFLEPSHGLIWDDLFDTAFDLSTPLIHNQVHGQAHSDHSKLFAQVTNRSRTHDSTNSPLAEIPAPVCISENQHTNGTNMPHPTQPPPYAPRELEEAEVLQDAHILLCHFRKNVIPQFGPSPMSRKSPWETLNWSNAVQTHAELTWLQGSNIKHANQANLFALLGCSAHMVTKSSPPSTELDSIRAAQVLEYTSKRAKRHMQESLRLETSGEGKAKYKDQLMAVFSLIALAVSHPGWILHLTVKLMLHRLRLEVHQRLDAI